VGELDEEDGKNFLQAMSIKRHYPDVHVRLMLLKDDTKVWAINSGVILPNQVCSLSELRAGMLGHSGRCHGFGAVVSNLLESDDVPNSEMGKEQWEAEYCNGSNNTFYAMVVDEQFAGQTWSQFASSMYEKQGVTPFAAQIDGHVILNPGQFTSKPLKGGEVSFFIAYQPYDVEQGDWIGVYREGAATTQTVEPGPAAQSTNAQETTRLQEGLGEDSAQDFHGHVQMGTEFTRRLLAQQIAEYGNHLLIISCTNSNSPNWFQVKQVLRSLRSADRTWEHRPVILLALSLPPDSLVLEYPDVLYLTGSPLNASDLLAGQPRAASDVLLLSDGLPASREISYQDQHTILVASALETILKTCTKDVHVMYDLFEADSANYLTAKLHGVPPSRRASVLHVDSLAEGAHANRTWKKHMGLWQDAVRLNTRFACGQLFTLNFVGRMMGREYYVPATIEVVLTLTTCRGQSSFPWLVPVPEEFDDKPYGELFKAWTEAADSAIPLGLQRLLCPGSASGLAKSLGYVVTNPTSEYILSSADQIFVLASLQFGYRMLATRLGLGDDKVPPWREKLNAEGSFYSINEDPLVKCNGQEMPTNYAQLSDAVLQVSKMQYNLQLQMSELLSKQSACSPSNGYESQSPHQMPGSQTKWNI